MYAFKDIDLVIAHHCHSIEKWKTDCDSPNLPLD